MTTEATADQAGAQRIRFLDGLRGIAIVWVMLHHAYARWPGVVPYGNRFRDVEFLAQGWLGVQLFFLISGFVIFMTLEKSAGYAQFIGRRWLRLFPAMLICSLLIFLSARYFPERPAGPPGLRDLLPGLTLVDPDWLAFVFRSRQGVLEGAFWSLFVEAKFYVIGGALYFLLGGRWMIAGLIALFMVFALALLSAAWFPSVDVRWLLDLAETLGLPHFGWFGAGALFYLYFQEGRRILLWLGLLVAIAAAAATALPAFVVVVIFTTAMVSPWMRRLLEGRAILFFGFISYPLYLLHENLLVAGTVKMGHLAPWLPAALLPLVPAAGLCALAWLVARRGEPWLRARLRALGAWLAGATRAAATYLGRPAG